MLLSLSETGAVVGGGGGGDHDCFGVSDSRRGRRERVLISGAALVLLFADGLLLLPLLQMLTLPRCQRVSGGKSSLRQRVTSMTTTVFDGAQRKRRKNLSPWWFFM